MKPCQHRGTMDGCRVCWLAEHNPKYLALWGKASPCVHLGAATGERRECDTCSGRVQLKLFACRHPEHTAPVALRDCQTCSDYEAQPPGAAQFMKAR